MSKTITNEQLDELDKLSNELNNDFNDLNKTNEILINMHKVLGIEPMFTSLDDFDNFMQSDKPLVF